MKWLIAFIVVILLLEACASKQQQDAAVADAAEIREFALSIASMDAAKALAMTDSLLLKAENDSSVYRQVTNYLEKWFGDPNSHYRNEDIYIHLLQQKMRSKWCDSLQKEQYRSKLFLRMQNRTGSAANDFEYLTPSGMRKRMYAIKANYLLLLFYNPECEACKEMRTALTGSSVIKGKVASGELKVLTVYTDKDEGLWLDHLKEMPESWIHGMDDNGYLYKNSVYDLKAIPTVYLLDKNKNVLLKDCMNVSLLERKLGITE